MFDLDFTGMYIKDFLLHCNIAQSILYNLKSLNKFVQTKYS